MRKLWVLLKNKKSTREVVALLAPIAICVAGGVWATVTCVWPSDEATSAAVSTAVCAEQAAAAAGNISRLKITNKASVSSPSSGHA